MDIREIEFNDILPIWRDCLWPSRTSKISPVSSIIYGTEPFRYESPNVFNRFSPTFFGAFVDGKLVGVNSGYKQGETYRSRGLYVFPEFRGQKIGQQLLEATKRAAIESGSKIFWSMPNINALRTYTAIGFQPTSELFDTETGTNCYVSLELYPAHNHVFHDQWAGHYNTNTSMLYSLNITPEQIDSIVPENYSTYRASAVKNAMQYVGDNPAVMLSGGIDSQMMLLSFWEVGIDIKPVIINYNNMNKMDTTFAIKFCEMHNKEYTVIDFDAVRFIVRDVINFGIEYHIRSPQFACHAKVCSILKEMGYTGATFGGNAMYQHEQLGWLIGYTSAQLLDLTEYGLQIEWPIIGNFLSHSWENCVALAKIPTKISSFDTDGLTLKSFNNNIQEHHDAQQKFAYNRYIQYYNKESFILPPHKYTGFENIREHINESLRQEGAMNTKFRLPMTAANPDYHVHTAMPWTDSQIRKLSE
jgi:GNAT superfamily N-acetyltransferase